jgi:hypothetical protein
MTRVAEIPGEVIVTKASNNGIVDSDEDKGEEDEEPRGEYDAVNSQEQSEEDDNELLGERPDPLSHELLCNPMPGTLLIFPSVMNSR